MLDLLEGENVCFQYFVEKQIHNRKELRESLKKEPIKDLPQNFIEFMFSNFNQLNKSIKQRKENKKNKISKTICISDLHIPYHDEKAVNLVFDCIVDTQPDNLVLNGDIIDCYWNSSFIKKPKNVCYLQEEADIFYKKFSYLRKYLPKTDIHYILGNHEERISKNQWSNPQFYGLEALEPENLLKLGKLNIKTYKTKLSLEGLLYFHGDRVRTNSSYTAKAEFEAHKMINGISGHTHRLGSHYKSYDGDTTFWYENGCLCTLNPDYIKDVVDWQHGFSIIDNYEGVNQVTQILIQNYKFNYNGVLYK